MARRLGQVVVDATAASGSDDVEVPALAQAVVVFWCQGSANADPAVMESLTLGGNNLLSQHKTEEPAVGDKPNVGVAYTTNLPAGGTRTLAWDWESADAPTSGGEIVLVWVEEVDPATPVRDSDTDSSTLAAAVTVTVDTESTDLVLAFGQSLNTNPLLTGTEFINGAAVSGHMLSASEVAPEPDGTTTVAVGDPAWSSVAAIVLRTAGVTEGETTVHIPIAQSSHDGHVYFTDPAWPPETLQTADTTQTTIDVERQPEGANYTIINGFLRFDTSVIPENATILSARLRIYVEIRDTADGKKVFLEYYDAGTIGVEDWTATPNNNAGESSGDISTLDFGLNDIDLTNVGNISKTGFTGLRVHLDGTGDPPTGDNWLGFSSFDHASNPPAELIVTYTQSALDDTGLVVRYYLDEAGSGFADAPSTSLILVPDEDPLSTDWSPTRPSANTREVKASGGVLSRATAGTPSGGMSHYDGAAFGPNLEAWAEVETLPPSGQGVSLTLCVTAGAGGTSSVDYYQGTYTVGTGWRMFYVVNNGYSQVGSTVASPVLAVGDKIWFLRTNGILRLYHQPDGSDEWDLVMSNTFTHASIPTTGGIGVELTDGVGQLKNFGGGTWTSQAEDAGPNAYHFTDIDYSFDSMQWIEDGSGNRGLDSTVLDNNQHVVRAMGDSGDPLRTALEGAQKIVIELVADPREGSANNARLIALNGRAGNDAALGITMPTASSPALALAWEGVAISSNLDAGTGRKVFHWVIDTTQATSADRLKVYVDGVFVGTVTNTLALNDTLVLPASLDFLLFNRFSGSVYDRSPDATLYYAAIYTGDFDAARVEDHANLLAADDDTPLAAPPPYFDVPAFRIVPMRMG